MKTQKRTFVNFRYKECDSFAEYLHNMSLEGWHFQRYSMGLIFEKGEPEDICYAVEVFPKGKEMDLKPEDDAQEYAEYCEAAGWKLIDGWKRFCIFRKVSSDAVDIVTHEERFDNIRKSEYRQWCGEAFTAFFITIVNVLNIWTNFGDRIFLDITLITAAVLLIYCLYEIQKGLSLFIWSFRTHRHIKQHEIPEYTGGSKRSGHIRNIIVVILTLGMTLLGIRADMTPEIYLLPVIVGFVIIVQYSIEISRPSRGGNYAVQLAATGVIFIIFIVGIGASIFVNDNETQSYEQIDRENVPLIKEDYAEVSDEIIYIDDGSFEGILGKRLHCYIEYGTITEEHLQEGAYISKERNLSENILYDVYYSEYDWVLDKIWKDEVEPSIDKLSECTAEWAAKEAYKKSGVYYYVRHSDSILILFTLDDLNTEQIAIICDKLEL